MPSKQGFFETSLIGEKIWAISGASNDLMYLVAGRQKAMLVDTGMGFGDLAGVVRELTSLPVMVVNTHGHPDHAGGNPAFAEIWLHPADEAILRRMCTDAYRMDEQKLFLGDQSPAYRRMANALVKYRPTLLKALRAKQVIDLGGRQFEVIETPGHTPGSICLLNEKEGLLFSGDTIVETPAWLYLKHSLPLSNYHRSLIELEKRKFDLIFPGHKPTPLTRANLDDLIACASEILAKPGIGKLEKTFAGEGLLWQNGKAKIIYDLKNI